MCLFKFLMSYSTVGDLGVFYLCSHRALFLILAQILNAEFLPFHHFWKLSLNITCNNFSAVLQKIPIIKVTMTVNVNHIWCDLVMHTLRSLYWTNRMLHGKGVKKFSALVPLILFQAQFIIALKWCGGGKVSRFIFKLLLESTLTACVPYLPTGLITLLLLKACYSFLSVPTHMHQHPQHPRL